jgi:hypothetical protein
VEGVEQVEEDDDDEDPNEDHVVNEGFDELEDLNESNQYMDTGREPTQSTEIQGTAGNHRTCAVIPECWEDLELSDDRLVIHPGCKSWHGDELADEWGCDTPMSHKSLPSRMDCDKMDVDVWEFEPQSITKIDEEALYEFEKSTNTAYVSEVLSSFNLDDTDEDMSDYDSFDGKVDDEMECLPQELVDRLGYVRKNLFPILERNAIDSADQDLKKPEVAGHGKQTWGPIVSTSRMATRNQGHVNMIEKTKEYQKRKNLKIPPTFKGNYFTSLPANSLCVMADKVDLKIRDNSPARMEIIQSLVSQELANNLKFARDNPYTVLPASLDIYNDYLVDHADSPSSSPTISRTEHR